MFKQQPQINQSFTKEFTVKQEHTAKHIGSGSAQVLSTPSLIGFMENTALQIDDYLEDDFATVGIEICIKHIKPANINQKVKCFAKIIEIDGKKITFEVECFTDEKIGFGTHKRYIINKQKFGQK